MTPDVKLLQWYGLDQLVTEMDDVTLWATVIAQNWPPPDDPRMNPSGLRFGVGQVDPEAPFMIKPTQGWCFEITVGGHLQVTRCHDEDTIRRLSEHMNNEFNPILGELRDTILFSITLAGAQYPYRALLFARPSKDMPSVPVYIATALGGRVGFGSTTIWRAQRNSRWQCSNALGPSWIS